MKKAQGLQFETIIIAVLVIAILFIMVFLITKHGLTFSKSASDCISNGGKCVSSRADCISQEGQPLDFNCPETSPACCKI